MEYFLFLTEHLYLLAIYNKDKSTYTCKLCLFCWAHSIVSHNRDRTALKRSLTVNNRTNEIRQFTSVDKNKINPIEWKKTNAILSEQFKKSKRKVVEIDTPTYKYITRHIPRNKMWHGYGPKPFLFVHVSKVLTLTYNVIIDYAIILNIIYNIYSKSQWFINWNNWRVHCPPYFIYIL